jgi:hypothetical protein
MEVKPQLYYTNNNLLLYVSAYDIWYWGCCPPIILRQQSSVELISSSYTILSQLWAMVLLYVATSTCIEVVIYHGVLALPATYRDCLMTQHASYCLMGRNSRLSVKRILCCTYQTPYEGAYPSTNSCAFPLQWLKGKKWKFAVWNNVAHTKMLIPGNYVP